MSTLCVLALLHNEKLDTQEKRSKIKMKKKQQHQHNAVESTQWKIEFAYFSSFSSVFRKSLPSRFKNDRASFYWYGYTNVHILQHTLCMTRRPLSLYALCSITYLREYILRVCVCIVLFDLRMLIKSGVSVECLLMPLKVLWFDMIKSSNHLEHETTCWFVYVWSMECYDQQKDTVKKFHSHTTIIRYYKQSRYF